MANLIIRMDVWKRFYDIARRASAFIASGRSQNQQGVIHVLASQLEGIPQAVTNMPSGARDFH